MSTLPGGEQLQRFVGLRGRQQVHVEAHRAELAVRDRRVEGGVVGVGEEVEHHRERLRARGAERVLLGAAGPEREQAGARQAGEQRGAHGASPRHPRGRRAAATARAGARPPPGCRSRRSRRRTAAPWPRTRGRSGSCRVEHDLAAEARVGAGGGRAGLGDEGADHAHRERDPRAAERRRQRRRELGEAQRLPARGVERAQQLRRSGSTEASPSTVVTSTGKKQISAITTSFGKIPKPHQNTSSTPITGIGTACEPTASG